MSEKLKDTPFEPRYDEIFFSMPDKDGVEKEYCVEETILAKLLVDGVLFCNSRPYVDLDSSWKGYGDYTNINKEETIVLFVICNDVFAWGCADCECITTEELPELYKMHMTGKWGTTKWVCKKRNLQPQAPMIKAMKKDNAWDDMMESLPKNSQ